MNETKRCFEPVVDRRTRLLILGSLPGEQSLLKAEYYGNKQNKFWSLMSAVIGLELVPLAYPARLQTLREHGVGLWDVVAEAQRAGSLDSRIREQRENDLTGLLQQFPQIRTVAFNGGTAARFGLKKLAHHASAYRIELLPSSSPAYTAPYAEKLQRWMALRAAL